MGKTLNTDLIYEVLSVVEEIPEGCVATYGQIARLTGRDRNANGCVDLKKYQWDC